MVWALDKVKDPRFWFRVGVRTGDFFWDQHLKGIDNFYVRLRVSARVRFVEFFCNIHKVEISFITKTKETPSWAAKSATERFPTGTHSTRQSKSDTKDQCSFTSWEKYPGIFYQDNISKDWIIFMFRLRVSARVRLVEVSFLFQR